MAREPLKLALNALMLLPSMAPIFLVLAAMSEFCLVGLKTEDCTRCLSIFPSPNLRL